MFSTQQLRHFVGAICISGIHMRYSVCDISMLCLVLARILPLIGNDSLVPTRRASVFIPQSQSETSACRAHL